MAKKNQKFIVPVNENTKNGIRLDVILAELSGRSRTEIRKLIVAGAVYVNRKRVRVASRLIQSGASLEFWAEEGVRFQLHPSLAAKSFQINENHILFEDEFLIAFNKPSGLPTQPTIDEARANAYALALQFLKTRDKKNDPKKETYLGLHHRLDKDTSGVLLFTKDRSANVGIGKLFQEHEMEKEYLAIVWGRPTPGMIIKNFLGKLPKERGGAQKFGAVRMGGDYAETAVEVLASARLGTDEISLVRAIPKTGRTHQIRVHLSESGHPVLGDPLYGRRGESGGAWPRLMLHAHRLSFVHPKTQVELKIEAQPPSEFFQLFPETRI